MLIEAGIHFSGTLCRFSEAKPIIVCHIFPKRLLRCRVVVIDIRTEIIGRSFRCQKVKSNRADHAIRQDFIGFLKLFDRTIGQFPEIAIGFDTQIGFFEQSLQEKDFIALIAFLEKFHFGDFYNVINKNIFLYKRTHSS